jgi:hypothetical protein
MKPITRNNVAVTIAVLAALILLSAPVAALFAIWKSDVRFLYTGGALLVLAAAVYFISTQLYDNTPKPRA